MSALRSMAWPIAFALAYPATMLAAAVWCLPASDAAALAGLLFCSPALFCLSYTGRRRSVCIHAWLCCTLLVLLILWCPSPSSPCRASLSVPVLRFACLSGSVFRCLPLPLPLPLSLSLSLSLLAWLRCHVFRLGGHVLLCFLVQLGCISLVLRRNPSQRGAMTFTEPHEMPSGDAAAGTAYPHVPTSSSFLFPAEANCSSSAPRGT